MFRNRPSPKNQAIFDAIASLDGKWEPYCTDAIACRPSVSVPGCRGTPLPKPVLITGPDDPNKAGCLDLWLVRK